MHKMDLSNIRARKCFQKLVFSIVVLVTLMSVQTAFGLALREGRTRYYFAYGSNMWPGTMERLRGITPISATAAILPNHQLVFDIPGMPLVEPSAASVRPISRNVRSTTTDKNKINQRTWNVAKRSSGYSGVDSTALPGYAVKDCVHGVLYELSYGDFDRVSSTEGVPFGYRWKSCKVYPYVGDGEDAGEKTMMKILSSSSPRGTTSNDNQVVSNAYTLYSTSLQPLNKNIPPSPSYLNILRKGAKYWKMDREYQDTLSNVVTAKNLIINDGLAQKLLDASPNNPS